MASDLTPEKARPVSEWFWKITLQWESRGGETVARTATGCTVLTEPCQARDAYESVLAEARKRLRVPAGRETVLLCFSLEPSVLTSGAPEAESPVTFTHPSVLAGIAAGAHWADPVTDPAEIDWSAPLERAAIPFAVVNGRPVNPCQSTGIRYGRNKFGHWGEALMADALVTVTLRGTRYLLMIERGDGYGWAVPGGHVEPGEAGLDAAVRELAEETGYTDVRLPECTAMPARYVPDPRSSDEAWAVTVPVHISQGMRYALPEVSGADDARRAEWVAADNFDMLAAELAYRFRGCVFAAHEGMLREFLDRRPT